MMPHQLGSETTVSSELCLGGLMPRSYRRKGFGGKTPDIHTHLRLGALPLTPSDRAAACLGGRMLLVKGPGTTCSTVGYRVTWSNSHGRLVMHS